MNHRSLRNRRPLLAAGGAACLAAAAALGAAQGDAGRRDPAAALGGLRVLASDALFLRAEGLRGEGRIDELPALYGQILALDPGNEDAIDFLAATEARDLRTLAPDAAARMRWWRAGVDLVEAGLRVAPDSARLHWRMADLLVLVPDGDAVVAAALTAQGRDREREGLAHLARSVRLTGSLPRLGFAHLDLLTVLAPRLAAERLARGAPGDDAVVAEALEAGDEGMRLRAGELADFNAGLDSEHPAAVRLLAGIQTVRFVRGALRASPPRLDDARAQVLLYAKTLGEDAVSRALSRVVR